MPSRKIISILIVAIALVTGIILASGSEREVSRKSNSNLVVKSEDIKLPATSGDWQKDLNSLPLSKDVQPSEASTTLTDSLSQSLMANYLSLKRQGTLDSTSATNLVNQATNMVDLQTKDKYTSGNLVISQDNSQAAIRNYGTSLGTSLKLNMPANPQNELMLMTQIAQSKSSDRLPELLAVAKVYRNLAISYSKITVPSSYTSLHLQLANSLVKLADAIDSMGQIFQDPVKALQGLSAYNVGYQEYATANLNIKNKILNDGVVYKQGESGYYFYFGI